MRWIEIEIGIAIGTSEAALVPDLLDQAGELGTAALLPTPSAGGTEVQGPATRARVEPLSEPWVARGEP